MLYFRDILEIGNLFIEKVLFEFDKMPIVFVCQNSKRDKYLCVCTDCIVGYSWMITRIERDILINLIKDKISILKAFEETQEKIYIVNKENDEYVCSKYDFADIPMDELPDEDEKLENPLLKDYLYQLELEETIAGVVWKSNSTPQKFLVFPKKLLNEVETISTLKSKMTSNSGYARKTQITPGELKFSYLSKETVQREQYIVSGTPRVRCMSI